MSVIQLHPSTPLPPVPRAPDRESRDLFGAFDLVMLAGWLAMTVAIFAVRV